MDSRQAAQPSPAFEIRRYLVNGKESSKADLASQPFIVAGAGLPDDRTAYAFSHEEAFYGWAAGTRHAPEIGRSVGIMKLGQQLENTPVGNRAVKRAEATLERLTREVEALSKETGLPIGTPELLYETHCSRSILEPPILGSAILFDKVSGSLANPDFGGSFFPFVLAFPTFFGFNDKASGALVLGICTLFDKTFYRGAAAFMISLGTPGSPGLKFVLADLGFDNRAASGIA